MGIALKLSESERIAIAEKLFKVTARDNHKGELHGLCPIHGEKSPSFSYNFQKDTYSCFSCTAAGDLCDLWSKVNGYDLENGFKAFCREHSIESSSRTESTYPDPNQGRPMSDSDPSKDPAMVDHIIPEEVWEKFPPLPEDWVRKLEETRGWSRRMIEILDIRQQKFYLDKDSNLKEVKKPEKISIPIRNVQGRLVNIRHYQPGAKQYKIISWGKDYGEARLFPAAPTMPDNPILLCEGESDTICALSNGFNAITQTSKTKNWSREHLDPFRGRDVIIAYDADNAGRVYTDFAAECLSKVAKSVRVIQWPSFMGVADDGSVPKDHGQDITDFFVRHKRTPAELQALIDSAPFWKSRIPPPPEIPQDHPEDGVYRFYDYGVNNRYSFKPRLLAEQILADISLMYEPSTSLLYKWNDRFWEVLHEDYIKAKCLGYLENESQKGRVEDATFQVRMLCTIPEGREINDRSGFFCVENGMYSMEHDSLHEHAKDYFATYMFPVVYDPEHVPICERWIQFLEETIQTPEVIAQVQEFFGYCLTPSTAFEKCLLCLGPGADGKSTMLKILRELVGPKNCAAVNIEDLDDQFQRSSLYGKLLNISTEVGSKAMESKIFKAIVSGDSINAAFKHQDFFEFVPTCKMAFAGNRFPRVLDNTDGFFRKILPVSFKKQFLTGGDKKLFDTLKSELSGIFNWALVGRERLWRNQEFTQCDETKRIMLDYRRSNNPVLCFAEDECEFGDVNDKTFDTPKKDLYELYKKYCKEKGYIHFSDENFFRELKNARNHLEQYRPLIQGKRAYHLKGIRIVPRPTEAP